MARKKFTGEVAKPIEGQPVRNRITQEEARNRIGSVIFGEDWISIFPPDHARLGDFSKGDINLLKDEKYGPYTKRVNNRPVLMIGPRPANLTKRLDVALGRAERFRLQISFVINWMCDRRVSFTSEVEVESVERAIAAWNDSQRGDDAMAPPSCGPRPIKMRRAMSAIKADIKARRLTKSQFIEMKHKEGAGRYKVSETLFGQAKKEILRLLNNPEK
jgi:hypothetical protein